MYTFQSVDREYTSWKLESIDQANDIEAPHLAPVDRKLLSGDILSSDYQLLSSPVRSSSSIPGVLVLSGTTYGRNSKNKILYKCIPDNPTLPIFLIPYTLKDIGFSKKYPDRYVTFEFREWNSKHPIGSLVQNIGEVSSNESFYEYQLHRRELVVPRMKKTEHRRILQSLSARPIETVVRDMQRKWDFEDRTERTIITIDPETCRDFDDALGIEEAEDGQTISVYISNVSAWLEWLSEWGMVDSLPSSIYLPHRSIPMLIEFLSTNLGSMVEGRIRPVLAMDIAMRRSCPVSIEFRLAVICVSKNYRYDDQELYASKCYN